MSFKLCAYKIDGTPVSQLSTFEVSDLNENHPFEIIDASDSVPSEYQDISSIENWDLFGNDETGKDYKFIRAAIKNIYYVDLSADWNGRSSTEKEILARYFLVDATKRSEIYTFNEQMQLGMKHHLESTYSRKKRFISATALGYNKLTLTDAFIVCGEMANLGIDVAYTEYGLEGTEVGDPEGLFDYIQAVESTSYENTGLAAKSITPTTGDTLQEVVDEMMEILRNGCIDEENCRLLDEYLR